MGKSKQKKNKYKDFQKVKLKVGKTLPKGLNETVATFKSKGIQIKEQLKHEADGDQPTTKRKLNINDLLSQCQHYSSSVRHDAVSGIRELLGQTVSAMYKHTGQIIEKCSELFLDKDAVVRSTVIKTLRLFFSKLTSNQMSAFFPMLSAHLCCAMTHIDDNIQQDSLDVLDLCLEYFPSLVVLSSSKIMSNFIEQISRQTQTSTKGSVQERSLLINPSSKLSSQKWRNKVLERLQKFFQAYIEHHFKKDNKDLSRNVKEYVWSEKGDNSVQILKSMGTESGQNQPFTFRSLQQAGSSLVGDRSLQSFVEVLVPLLLQCWVEAGPSQLATSLVGNALSGGAMTMLWNVLRVLQLLMEIIDLSTNSSVDLKWFAEKYLNDLVQYFMPYFPYSMHEQLQKTRGSKGSKSVAVPQISVRTLNLSVCKVMSYFIARASKSSQWQEKVLDYLTDSLPRTKLNGEQVALVVAVIDTVIRSVDDEDCINSLLEVAYEVMISRQQSFSTDMRTILKFFNHFAFTKYALQSERYEVLDKWVSSLPLLMWQAMKLDCNKMGVLSDMLHYMKNAGPYRKETFINNLRKLLFVNICEENNHLQQLTTNHQKRLVELVYWLPEITRSEYQQLSKLCLQTSIGKDVIYHLLNVLTSRLSKLEESDYKEQTMESESKVSVLNMEISHYLSFMLTLIIGKSNQCSPQFSYNNVLYGTCIAVDKDCTNVKDWERRVYLIQNASQIVTNLPTSCNCADIIKLFIRKYLQKEETTKTGVQLLSALGVITLLVEVTTSLSYIKQNQQITDNTTDNENSSTSHSYNENSRPDENFLKSIVEESNLANIVGALLSLLLNIDSGSLSVECSDNRLSSDMDCDDEGGNVVETMETSDDPGGDSHSKTCIEMDKDLKNIVWDMAVKSLIRLPYLCRMYVGKTCDQLCGVTDVDQIKPTINVLTNLLNNKQLNNILKSEEGSLSNVISQMESRTQLNEQWWTAFKYEVSMLKQAMSKL